MHEYSDQLKNTQKLNGRGHTVPGTYWNALHHCFQRVPKIFTLAVLRQFGTGDEVSWVPTVSCPKFLYTTPAYGRRSLSSKRSWINPGWSLRNHSACVACATTYRFESRLSVLLGWLPDATGDRECRRFRCLILCLWLLEVDRLRDRPILGFLRVLLNEASQYFNTNRTQLI